MDLRNLKRQDVKLENIFFTFEHFIKHDQNNPDCTVFTG
jgi:hypothetical protein